MGSPRLPHQISAFHRDRSPSSIPLQQFILPMQHSILQDLRKKERELIIQTSRATKLEVDLDKQEMELKEALVSASKLKKEKADFQNKAEKLVEEKKSFEEAANVTISNLKKELDESYLQQQQLQRREQQQRHGESADEIKQIADALRQENSQVKAKYAELDEQLQATQKVNQKLHKDILEAKTLRIKAEGAAEAAEVEHIKLKLEMAKQSGFVGCWGEQQTRLSISSNFFTWQHFKLLICFQTGVLRIGHI